MLSAGYVQYIHDNLVAVMWPGSDPVGPGGCRDINLLESAVGRPFQSAFGEDAYPTILEKAIALFHSLNSNHPFHDGNKRTAIIALDDFLVANVGVVWCYPHDDLSRRNWRNGRFRSRYCNFESACTQVRDKVHTCGCQFPHIVGTEGPLAHT